ncbi:MAG: VOC family protein [Pseudonocardiaceae bacterium]
MAAQDKQQFNVYLEPELVRATKRASVDRGQSLSSFVADALRAHVQTLPGREHTARASEVSPRPIMFVHDMRATLAFCRALGLRLGARSRNGRWAELSGPTGTLGLHAADADEQQRVELAFEAHGPLEPIAERLTAAGFSCPDIVDEGYGRSLCVQEPNGLAVQIDEIDNALL